MQAIQEQDWHLVKKRTAQDGAVYTNADRSLYKRTGDSELSDEATFQASLEELGYPVGHIVLDGNSGDEHFFIENSLGEKTLHELAVADAELAGRVSEETIDKIIAVSVALLDAQATSAWTGGGDEAVEKWFRHAAFLDNVLEENPDFNNERTKIIIERLVRKLGSTAISHGHMDYGLPNALENGVIDWQHYGDAPVGYDVFPMLDIAAFKGGIRGYEFTDEQRKRYFTALSEHANGGDSAEFIPEFLLTKAFFFLALMKPEDETNIDKMTKWQYRRHLLTIVMDAYERDESINTGQFPTLDEFKQSVLSHE